MTVLRQIWQYKTGLAFLTALTALLGSLYFSEVAGYVPCNLCWYQRILMYPLVVIILVGWIERDDFLPKYVLPFSVSGILVAAYHYMIQWGVFSNNVACAIGISCSLRYINWWGFVTIPFLALVAFILITIFMLALRRSLKEE